MKLKSLAVMGALALFASSLYGIALLSPSGSQTQGGVLTNTTLTNMVADFTTLQANVISNLAYVCGATTTCTATPSASIHIFVGSGTLATGSPSTFALTGMSPAFTGTTTYTCNAIDVTTAATNISVLTAGYVSGSAVTFTGPNTNTDVFRYTCVGS
jgi:hypothetical protein